MALKLAKNFVVLFQGDSSIKENKYYKCLKKESIKAKVIPALSFNFTNKEKVQECLYNYDLYSGMIFTSTRAVTAASLSYLKMNETCTEHWKKKIHFSVGKSTAADAFIKLNLNTCGSDSGSSERLCKFIIKMCDSIDKPLLFLCSNIRKDTIPTMLSEKNIPFQEVVCYETVPNEHFEKSWHDLITEEGSLPSILVFFSPSGVQSCLDIIKSSYESVVMPNFIAIGSTTEKALLEAGIECKVAEKPTPESVRNIVKDLKDI